ncbi:MAG: hypothetical protein V7K38_18425 [Nostoc sp.]|uniref:hypothetical protein n=1 Tax=Nostoc sp. TaxID=1180 RepID=UPI002FF9E764
MNEQHAKREASRVQANRDELVERISQAIRHDGTIEPLKGLHLHRFSSPMEACHAVSGAMRKCEIGFYLSITRAYSQ